MRIQYILPGPLSRTELGAAEIERREAYLRAWASPETEVDARDVPFGPASIESAYEEYLSVPPTAHLMLEAEQAGYDAAILGCFGDPGIDAMRELLTRMVVVGPAESSCYASLMLGDAFGIVTVTASVVRPVRDVVTRLGVEAKLAGIAVVESAVLDLYDRDRTVERALAAATDLVAHRGANVLVLGCMTMAFLDVGEDLERALGVPVVNPVRTSLRIAEALTGAHLRHSKLAYPLPPKVEGRDHIDLADLVLDDASAEHLRTGGPTA